MPVTKRRGRQVGLLHHRDFRHLWAADALSQLGSRISLLALPLLAVMTLNASTFQVSLIKTLQTVPYLLFGLQVGVWCDRLRCRPLLMVADLVRLLALLSIPVAAAFGVLTLWQCYAAVFVTGLLTVFFDVAHQTYLPRLIGRDRLIEGNTKLWTNQSVAAIAAPTLSGLLIQWFTAPAAVVVDALTYLWSALWLRSIRQRENRPPEPEVRRRLRREVSEGARVVLGDPILRAIGLNYATIAFFQNLNLTITVVFLVREVGLAPGTIGVLNSFALLGALAGSAATGRLAAALGAARLLCLVSVLEGLAYLLYPLTGPGWRLGFLVVAGFVASACLVVQNVVEVSFQQARCPERLLGRVNATMTVLYWGVAPIGSVAAGILATVLGFRLTLLIAGVGILCAAIWIIASPVRHLRDLPAQPPIAETA